ncbi:MAG: hypothetical protein CSA11_10905 [Chloroflexi bacterium]|nr:MAG: hypothetical protein CSB13_10995 [Chloroflexota bacterium]PIE79727.1 MAG: hypothetical protein CSA11_10905 [Chloroflexota bacterium]
MKYQKFIILLLLITLSLAACRRGQNQPTEEELSKTMPQEHNYASGSVGYPVLTNGVGIEVDRAGLPAVQDDSNPDYVHVILDLTVTNESEYVVVPPGMTLVDDHDNIYVSWQDELPYDIVRMPLSVNSGAGVTGHLAYVVPKAAIQDNLRLRWESDLHQCRIDVFLGPLGERYPLPE